MISFPVWYLGAIWAIGVVVLLIISGVHLIHATRFGHFSVTSVVSTSLFVVGMAMLIWMTFMMLGGLSWTHPVQFEFPTLSLPGLS